VAGVSEKLSVAPYEGLKYADSTGRRAAKNAGNSDQRGVAAQAVVTSLTWLSLGADTVVSLYYRADQQGCIQKILKRLRR